MPRKTLEVTVEPKVLIWIRKSMGINIQKVAKKNRGQVLIFEVIILSILLE